MAIDCVDPSCGWGNMSITWLPLHLEQAMSRAISTHVHTNLINRYSESFFHCSLLEMVWPITDCLCRLAIQSPVWLSDQQSEHTAAAFAIVASM